MRMALNHTHQLWFRSDKFQIHQNEDDETNPHCFGRDFAEFLKDRLTSEGYPVENVIPEDWGWCVMCSRKPFNLWVGCSNLKDYDIAKPSDSIPKGSDVVWSCVVVAETSIFNKMFGKLDTRPQVGKLFGLLQHILGNEIGVKFVDQP